METEVKPRAWLCELAAEDGTTRTQFVEEDPDGLRWNDAGEPSPYRTTPLYASAEVERLRADAMALRKMLAECQTPVCVANRTLVLDDMPGKIAELLMRTTYLRA